MKYDAFDRFPRRDWVISSAILPVSSKQLSKRLVCQQTKGVHRAIWGSSSRNFQHNHEKEAHSFRSSSLPFPSSLSPSGLDSFFFSDGADSARTQSRGLPPRPISVDTRNEGFETQVPNRQLGGGEGLTLPSTSNQWVLCGVARTSCFDWIILPTSQLIRAGSYD